jgi:hypothetical protein
MAPAAPTLPLPVRHRDCSGLFAVETTVVAWREHRPEERLVTLTLGTGTLHDADKGAFGLEGLELTFRVVDDRVEPAGIPAPGVLSEVQQEVLLDAVSTALAVAANQSQLPRSDQ